MANEAVKQVVADYYRDFSTLNVQAILPYFNEPSLLVGPQGVIPIADRAALVGVFGPVMEGLRGKAYGRSELQLGIVKSLSSSAALIGGVAVRYKTDGQQLERVGVTYVLHKTESGWKFATVILHEPKVPNLFEREFYAGNQISPDVNHVGPSIARILSVGRQRIEYVNRAGQKQFIDLEECAGNWVRWFDDHKDDPLWSADAERDRCVALRGGFGPIWWTEFMNGQATRFEFDSSKARQDELEGPLIEAGWRTFDTE